MTSEDQAGNRPYDIVDDPTDVGLTANSLDDLITRAQRDVNTGAIPSCQLAVARHGRLVAHATLGDASPGDRYLMFSCTKALTAASVWLLIGDGHLSIDQRAAEFIPEFATNAKDNVTIRHLLTHTAGFPQAPLGPPDWLTRDGRRQRFARWRLVWEPGTRFEYHPTSAHWVLAEVIEEVTGTDHREFFTTRVAGPLGVGVRIGVPEADQANVQRLVATGEPPTPAQLAAAGVPQGWDPGEVVNDNLLVLNDPANLALGVPAAGGVGTAADLAMFYQALLANPHGLFDPAVLAAGTAEVFCDLPDPLLGFPALRTLGLYLAGGDGHSALRGFGRTTSARTFGHNGAGGQIAWADPDTGISFAYLTNGLDAFVPNQWRRQAALTNRAGALVGGPAD